MKIAVVVGLTQGCSRSIDLGGKDQDLLIDLDLFGDLDHHHWTCKTDLDLKNHHWWSCKKLILILIFSIQKIKIIFCHTPPCLDVSFPALITILLKIDLICYLRNSFYCRWMRESSIKPDEVQSCWWYPWKVSTDIYKDTYLEIMAIRCILNSSRRLSCWIYIWNVS